MQEEMRLVPAIIEPDPGTTIIEKKFIEESRKGLQFVRVAAL